MNWLFEVERDGGLITSGFLRKFNACEDQIAILESEWPRGVELTLPNLLRAIELGLNIGWLASHLLYDQDCYDAIYLPVTKSAYKEYRRAIGCAKEAYDNYDTYIAAASSVYDVVGDDGTEGVIDRCEAFFQQLEPAHQALKRARAPHVAVLHTALAHGLIDALEYIRNN